MTKLLKGHCQPLTGKRVIDVGSYDRNAGSYRPVVEKMGGTYTGLDLEAGPNVDIVVPDSDDWSTLVEPAEIVISGQCLEHTRMPWLWIKAVVSVLQPGGMLLLIAPWQWKIHRWPLDCWRILPDGMDALFEWAGLERIHTETRERDCYGIARKPA